MFVKPFVIHLGESYNTNGLFIVNRSMILKQALIQRAVTRSRIIEMEMTISKRNDDSGKIQPWEDQNAFDVVSVLM